MDRQQKYSGFTLIEILVVVGLIAILAAITIVAINPAKNFEQTRDAQRSSDVTAILNAITQFTSEEGNTIESFLVATGFPDIDTDGDRADEMVCGTTEIGIATGIQASPADEDTSGTADVNEYIDIDTVLVDEYIVAIPQDPSQAVSYTNLVDSGYTMCVTTGGRVRITATPERATSITVSR